MLPLLALSVASAYAGERETFDFGWKRTGGRAAHKTAHNKAEDMKALVLPPEPSAAAPWLLPQDLGCMSRPQLFFL